MCWLGQCVVCVPVGSGDGEYQAFVDAEGRDGLCDERELGS